VSFGVDAVVFDFDGLMLDTEVPVYAAWCATFESYGAAPPTLEEWGVYIGTDSGVLTSENGGETFDPVNAGPATVRVSKLFWMGSKLVAATYGRGVYAAEVKSPQ